MQNYFDLQINKDFIHLLRLWFSKNFIFISATYVAVKNLQNHTLIYIFIITLFYIFILRYILR
jgi:hypothetical protein